jgi:hypothetical protein
MSDYSRHDVADRLALYLAAESDADLRRVIAENESLRIRLAASLEREREADQAVRALLAVINATPRGVIWALWVWITRRQS